MTYWPMPTVLSPTRPLIRLRSTVATLGYSSNEVLDQDKLYRDEIDPETLDAISLAGARFEWIQKKLRSV